MKKVIFAAALMSALLAGCSSLPDGARNMTLKVTNVEMATVSGKEGFNVEYTVEHQSLEPMPLERVEIDVEVNDKLAGRYLVTKETFIPPRRENTYNVFVPANKSGDIARESIRLTPMLQMNAKATVYLLVEDDVSSEESKFNVKDTFEGIIHESAE